MTQTCVLKFPYPFRSRGDRIETYKLLTGKYDQQVALTLPKNVTGEYFTRGSCNKLLVKRCRYELRLANRPGMAGIVPELTHGVPGEDHFLPEL